MIWYSIFSQKEEFVLLKRRRQIYHSTKKDLKRDKYYNKLCEEDLKKHYRSIPVEDRLPVGILEPDQTELSSSHDEMSNNLPEMSNHPPDIKQCDRIDEYPDKSNFHVPQLFDPILISTQESMPSAVD